MHLMHLATFPDTLVSMLCDLTDGPNRDRDLTNLWDSYKQWCDEQGTGEQRTMLLSNLRYPNPESALTCTENIPSPRCHGQGYEEIVYGCNLETIFKRLRGVEPKADERKCVSLCDVLAVPADGADVGEISGQPVVRVPFPHAKLFLIPTREIPSTAVYPKSTPQGLHNFFGTFT